LELMTGMALGLTEISDYFDIEDGKAWVEFVCGGEKYHWDLAVDNDWMDPYIIVKYDALLKQKKKGISIYVNQTDYGQVGFLGAFSEGEFKTFSNISRAKLIPISKQP